ncbi:MAG: TetR/AcrR family transcriptional regulator [Sphingobium sp.]
MDQEILNTALRVFSDKGYGNATVNQICTSAGISLATFYRHYTGKDDIFRVVMQRFHEQEARTIETVENMGLEEGLIHIANTHLSNMRNSPAPEGIRLIYAEAPRFPEIAQEFVNGTMRWLRPLMNFLQKYDVRLSDNQAYDLAILFMNMVGSRLEHEMLLRIDTEGRKRADHAALAVRIFLNGFTGR